MAVRPTGGPARRVLGRGAAAVSLMVATLFGVFGVTSPGTPRSRSPVRTSRVVEPRTSVPRSGATRDVRSEATRPLTVSVVIPAFRAAGTIARAVASVLAQTAPAHEIIVVDDGSPDDLAAALAPFGDRVILVRQANGGVSRARNTGIDRATGDVIAFLDADDWWEPDKIERQLDVLAAHPEVGIVGSALYLQEPDADHRQVDPALDVALYDRVLELDGPAAFRAAGMFWTGTVAIRRDVLGDQRFDPGLSTAEDRDLWLRMFLRAPAWLDATPLATCVLVPGSLSRSSVERDCRNMLSLVDRYRELLGEDAHADWVADVHRRWSTRLLAQGDGRGALVPALEHLRLSPSPTALWTVARSAVVGARTALTGRADPAATAPLPGPVKVSVVRDRHGLAALATEWGLLHDRSAHRVIPMTFEWMQTWWEVFGDDDGRELRLLVARDHGRLIGVAPLLIRTVLERGVPLRRLELLASGEDEADEIFSEYLDFVVEAGREPEVITALCRQIAAMSDWDELWLRSIPTTSPLRAGLHAALASTRYQHAERPRAEAIAVPLAATAEAFLAAQTKKMREDLRRHRRALAQHGPVRLRRAGSVFELRAMFPELIRLHQALWESRGKPGCFASARFTEFHQRVSERLFARGLVHFHLLEVGDRAIAARYAFHLGDRLFEYQSGLDPTFDPKVSTGMQCGLLCMEDAISRGFAEYDLGEGPRPYKLRWNHVRRQTVDLLVSRRNTRTRLRALLAAGETRLRAWRGRARA